MTLSSDILDSVLTFNPSVLIQFPYILSAVALIILSGLFVLRNMERTWYWAISIIMILALSMSDMLGLKVFLFGQLYLEHYT